MRQTSSWGWWSTSGSPGPDMVSNQFAAMPSLHCAWAAWCGIVVFLLVRRTWVRVLAVLYPLTTFVAVMATGNHYLLDIVAGVGLLAAGRRRRPPRRPAGPRPAGAGGAGVTALARTARGRRRGGSGPVVTRCGPLLAAVAAAVTVVWLLDPPLADLQAALAREQAADAGVGLTYWFSWYGGISPGSYSSLVPFLSLAGRLAGPGAAGAAGRRRAGLPALARACRTPRSSAGPSRPRR